MQQLAEGPLTTIFPGELGTSTPTRTSSVLRKPLVSLDNGEAYWLTKSLTSCLDQHLLDIFIIVRNIWSRSPAAKKGTV